MLRQRSPRPFVSALLGALAVTVAGVGVTATGAAAHAVDPSRNADKKSGNAAHADKSPGTKPSKKSGKAAQAADKKPGKKTGKKPGKAAPAADNKPGKKTGKAAPAADNEPGQQPGKAAPAADNKPGQQPGNAAPDNDQGADDPPGNNGTVKIIGLGDIDTTPENNPHPGCRMGIEWYGFDEGGADGEIISTVTFTMQAPTADAELTVVGPSTVDVGGDPAGGGTDLDGREWYELTAEGEPHPKQGYHVKLTVHTEGSKGADTKHKVFWLEECPPGPGPEAPPGAEAPITPPGAEAPITPPGAAAPITPPGRGIPDAAPRPLIPTHIAAGMEPEAATPAGAGSTSSLGLGLLGLGLVAVGAATGLVGRRGARTH